MEYNARLEESGRSAHDPIPNEPRIVCLCGSGRFCEAFEQAEFDETLSGKIVLTIGCNTHDVARSKELLKYKPMLDELHKYKIGLSHEILVLNVGGYIGESTHSEIEYAQKHRKQVRYLEEIKSELAEDVANQPLHADSQAHG